MHTDESATNKLIFRNCCRTCGQAKLPEEFYRDRRAATGHQASCKECQKQRAAAWQRAHPERHLAHVYAWKASHAEQVNRHDRRTRSRRDQADMQFVRMVVRVASITRRAIASGRLIRPEQCSGCDRRGVALDAVHEDYAEPLEVTWLCRRCHYRWNQARRQPEAKENDQ